MLLVGAVKVAGGRTGDGTGGGACGTRMGGSGGAKPLTS
jgi:hypothetical protein